MRGGTSKALMFRRDDLPADRGDWDRLFLTAMGSPDPYGRQLNGMGGGLSSLSKVCVVGPSNRADADVDFTFAQVQIGRSLVDYSGNCGNMSAAIGPFALHSGLLERADGDASVVVHNTNTAKLMRAGFTVKDGEAVEDGVFPIPGVGGTGAPIRLDFLEPGGSTTGALLPTGSPTFDLATPAGTFSISVMDAGNVCVFVRAHDLGLTGTETPEQLDGDADALATIATIRAQASVAMGLTRTIEEARDRPLTPFIAVVGAPGGYSTSDGQSVGRHDYELSARFVSNGQPHRAVPGTGALCLAVAARIPGTLVAELSSTSGSTLRVGTPAGVVPVEADVRASDSGWHAVSATSFRTCRRLFTGQVFV
ncbi:PrpF family protein [Amycolatopsis sp. A1MSW2902]